MADFMEGFSKALEGVMADAMTTALAKASRDVDGRYPMTLQDAKPQQLPPEPAQDEPKGLLFDPFALIDQLGYRDRPSGLTYQTLRQMARRVPTFTAIEQIRVNQVCAFAQPQEDEREPGFAIELRDPKKTPGRKDQQRMNELTDWVLQTGTAWGPTRDDFRTFLHKLTRDSLELDQATFETCLNNKGVPAEFVCLDGATMRLADIPPGAEHRPDLETIKYVQVYDEMIIGEFPINTLCWGIRNPRSDIRANGYGYCLHPDSLIATDRGLVRVADLDGAQFGAVLGGKVFPATAFSTGRKAVWTLRLADGRTVQASADHRFYCMGPSGQWGWRRLEELSPGDRVATDMRGCEGGEVLGPWKHEPGPGERSKAWALSQAGDDLWEVIGWMVGDGNLTVKTGRFKGKAISLFYADGEESIARKHREVLRAYGLPDAFYPRKDGLCGEIKFNHEGFGRWLLEQAGFHQRGGGIPSAVFTLPMAQRCAFLRGLFSADGHLGSSDVPVLGCTDRALLQDVQRILISVGIRCRWTHGKIKKAFGQRLQSYDDGRLYVYDKDLFFDRIGFYQNHKQPVLGTYQGTRADVVSKSFARRAAQRLKSRDIVDRRIRGLLEDPPRWGVTRSWLSERAERAGDTDLLEDLQWSQTAVLSVEASDLEVEMYDVSVDSEFHGFTVDGIVVHNSELEMLINVITASLWAFEYNKKFFAQGTAAKGLVNLKGGVPDSKMDAFRRMWQMMVSGVSNAHRTPMVSVDDVQWIDLHKSNVDMEYSAWMDWLIKITCATMLMDPAELNFSYGNSGQSSQMFQAPVEQKLKQSKDRGLRPLLNYFAKWINTHLIWRLDPNYRLVFRGLDAKSEDQKVDLSQKKSKYLMTIDELRAEEDLPPLPDGQGAIILDPTFLQNKQAAEMAAQGDEMGEGGEEEQPAQVPGVPGIDDEEQPEAEDDGGDFEQLFSEQKSMSAARRLSASRQRLESGQLLDSDPLQKARVTVYEIDL